MTRPLLILVLFAAASARPAEACAMYLPPVHAEVVVAEPVVHPEAPVADAAAPDATDLQRAMALIDAVALIPEVTAAPVAQAAPEPARSEARGVAKTSPPMAAAPAR